MSKKNQGYVKFPREVLLDKRVLRHKYLPRVLMYLYGRAQHKNTTTDNGRGMPIHLKPGQLHVPMRDMAEDLGMSYGSLNRLIMDHRWISYWTVHKSKAGNVIELKFGIFGSQDGSQDAEKSVSRSNRVLSSKVSNRGKGVPQEVTEKWLEGRALSTGIQHDDLSFREEIAKARVLAEESDPPRIFNRGYMWQRWCYAVSDAKRFGKLKKSRRGGETGGGVILTMDNGEFTARA